MNNSRYSLMLKHPCKTRAIPVHSGVSAQSDCSKCGFVYHRDGVGAINIRGKYLGESQVVGAMASPVGVRYKPHMQCRSEMGKKHASFR